MCLWQCLAELWGSECMCPENEECPVVWCLVCVQSMVADRGLCKSECVARVCVQECQRLCCVWLFGGLWWEVDHRCVSGLCDFGGPVSSRKCLAGIITCGLGKCVWCMGALCGFLVGCVL